MLKYKVQLYNGSVNCEFLFSRDVEFRLIVLFNVIFCECFIKVSKHEKTDESMRLKAECVYCFREFGNPDET